MTEIIRKPEFEKAIKKIKDNKTKERVKKQIKKIIESPEHGNFIKYEKNERKIYIPPFRLLYSYDKREDKIYLIDFDKRDKIYKKRR